jgi:hypothetical protein
VGRNGQVLLIIGIFIYLYWIWCNSPKEPWPGPKKKCSCLFIQLGPGDLPHAHSLFLPCTSNWDLFGKSRVRDLLVPTQKTSRTETTGKHRTNKTGLTTAPQKILHVILMYSYYVYLHKSLNHTKTAGLEAFNNQTNYWI